MVDTHPLSLLTVLIEDSTAHLFVCKQEVGMCPLVLPLTGYKYLWWPYLFPPWKCFMSDNRKQCGKLPSSNSYEIKLCPIEDYLRDDTVLSIINLTIPTEYLNI